MRRSIAQVKGKLQLGAFPWRSPAHLAATCALPASTTATEIIQSNVQDEPQSVRLATCLDRSVAASGAIASTVSPCFPWRKLLSPGGAPGAGRAAPAWRAPAAGRAPGDARAAPALGGSSGQSEPSNGLEPFRRPLGRVWASGEGRQRALRTVARAWGAGGRATTSNWKTIGAGPAARLLGGWTARAAI